MRNRIHAAQTSGAARRDGLGLAVSAICLLAVLPAAHAQSTSSADGLYQLRGTSEQPLSTDQSAASSLYGALPTTRPGSSGATTTTIEADAFGTTATVRTADDPLANPAQPDREETTGAVGSPSDLSQADQDYAASLARQNARTGTVDGLSLSDAEEDDVPGLSIGTFTLRPTLEQRIVHESVRYGTDRTSRIYSQTTLSGVLESDWSRHQLRVDGSGTWQENLSGTGTATPSANFNALLTLDLVDDFTALFGTGYSYSQESRTDPNAISGATAQAGVHELRASAGLAKNLGLLRGTTTLDITRTMYGSATLADGSSLLVKDRNTLGAEITTRIGYQVSPALVPFVETTIGREKYDQRIDSSGSERSSTTLGARAGAEINLGEKLSGEFAAGYVLRSLDDANLADISGLTVDGELNWSPQRGTDVNLGLATTLESATSAGQSGAVVYEFDSTLSQQLRHNLVARLGATAGLRDYDSGSNRENQQSYGASAGITWNINRYLDLDADASYERTTETGSTDEEEMTVGVGLRLRR